MQDRIGLSRLNPVWHWSTQESMHPSQDWDCYCTTVGQGKTFPLPWIALKPISVAQLQAYHTAQRTVLGSGTSAIFQSCLLFSATCPGNALCPLFLDSKCLSPAFFPSFHTPRPLYCPRSASATLRHMGPMSPWGGQHNSLYQPPLLTGCCISV